MKKKGLGRSFDSLIPTNLLDETFDPTAKQDDQVSRLRQLPIDQVEPDKDQPRRFFDEEALRELAASVAAHGVVQPIVVTPQSDDRYVIVAGERRWRAARLAGLADIPCIVRSLSGQHRLEVSLIENLQRRDLNALETATAYLKLRDQFNMTLEQIGRRVGGKSVSAVSNTLRLLKLPKVIQQALYEGKLSEGQARPLVGLPHEVAEELMTKAISHEWSVRRIEQAISLWKQAQTHSAAAARVIPEQPHTEAVERLTSRFQAPIKIRTNTRGAGQIIIPFKDGDDFDRIQRLLD